MILGCRERCGRLWSTDFSLESSRTTIEKVRKFPKTMTRSRSREKCAYIVKLVACHFQPVVAVLVLASWAYLRTVQHMIDRLLEGSEVEEHGALVEFWLVDLGALQRTREEQRGDRACGASGRGRTPSPGCS